MSSELIVGLLTLAGTALGWGLNYLQTERRRNTDRQKLLIETRLILQQEMRSNRALAVRWRGELGKWAGRDIENPLRIVSMDGPPDFVISGAPPFSTTVWTHIVDRVADAYPQKDCEAIFAHYALVAEIDDGFERLTRMREMQDRTNQLFNRHGVEISEDLLRLLDQLTDAPIP